MAFVQHCFVSVEHAQMRMAPTLCQPAWLASEFALQFLVACFISFGSSYRLPLRGLCILPLALSLNWGTSPSPSLLYTGQSYHRTLESGSLLVPSHNCLQLACFQIGIRAFSIWLAAVAWTLVPVVQFRSSRALATQSSSVIGPSVPNCMADCNVRRYTPSVCLKLQVGGKLQCFTTLHHVLAMEGAVYLVTGVVSLSTLVGPPACTAEVEGEYSRQIQSRLSTKATEWLQGSPIEDYLNVNYVI